MKWFLFATFKKFSVVISVLGKLLLMFLFGGTCFPGQTSSVFVTPDMAFLKLGKIQRLSVLSFLILSVSARTRPIKFCATTS